MKPETSEIHPELRLFAKSIPTLSFNPKNLWLLRFMSKIQPVAKPPPDMKVENILIPAQEHQPQIRVRLYKPLSPAGAVPVLLWLHGGGYVMGRPEMDDACCTQYVQETGIMVASVDYRHAPEHPFPAGLDDAYTSLLWLVSHSAALGIDPARIAIGGNSAGGGLAAALAQRAHDLEQVSPVLQLLVYPMLDDRTSAPDVIDRRHYLIWNQECNRFGWESYLGHGCGTETTPDYAVPARRKDLSGLPPAWIGVGSLDLFHNEITAYAQRLLDSGVNCELVIVPGAFHGFDIAAVKTMLVQDFRASQIEALKRYLRI